MNITEMADLIHKELLALPKNDVKQVLDLVMDFKEQNSPEWEAGRKAALEHLKQLCEKYRKYVKITPPLTSK